MHIRAIEVSNLGSIRQASWKLSRDQGAGFHVILGDNGSGKSSFVKAVAMALVGPDELAGLWENWSEWLRHEERRAEITLQIRAHEDDEWKGRGKQSRGDIEVKLTLSRGPDGSIGFATSDRRDRGSFRSVWSNYSGWFSASFGPFRRFRGGDAQFDKLFFTHKRLARHLSAFDEGVALSEGLTWLQKLAVDKLMNPSSAEARLLSCLQRFVNENHLLPQQTTLTEITPKQIEFRDGQGQKVSIAYLADGFRATLSMTFELIRQLALVYGPERIFPGQDIHCIPLPGVVLIDEIDAHLHPSWQHEIGSWFKKFFPNIQFIVTTHSPILCQAAEGATIYKLPTPGTEEGGGMLDQVELHRLIYGDILDAYSTSAFDAKAVRSDSGRRLIEELAGLNHKALHTALSPQEAQRQKELRAILPGQDLGVA